MESLPGMPGWRPQYYNNQGWSNNEGELCFKHGSYFRILDVQLTRPGYMPICLEDLPKQKVVKMHHISYLKIVVKRDTSTSEKVRIYVNHPNIYHCYGERYSVNFSFWGKDTTVLIGIPQVASIHYSINSGKAIGKSFSTNYKDTAYLEILY
jgi:hypothetical protein